MVLHNLLAMGVHLVIYTKLEPILVKVLQELPTKSEMGSYAPPYWGSMVSVASIGELSWSLGVLRAVCDR